MIETLGNKRWSCLLATVCMRRSRLRLKLKEKDINRRQRSARSNDIRSGQLCHFHIMVCRNTSHAFCVISTVQEQMTPCTREWWKDDELLWFYSSSLCDSAGSEGVNCLSLKQRGWAVILTLLRVSRGHLWQVSEVVSFHFEVEHLALCLRCIGNEEFVEQVLEQTGTGQRSVQTWNPITGRSLCSQQVTPAALLLLPSSNGLKTGFIQIMWSAATSPRSISSLSPALFQWFHLGPF